MDVMFQTVNLGVISYEELAQQLGDVVPMAAAAGVKFDDMSAALAAITLSGIPAAEAVTALNMLLTRVMKPTQDLRQAVKDLGYESAASAVEQDGLYVVVNKLNGAAGNTAEGIANMWKDIRATRAALALAAAGGQNYADTYAGIANEVARAEATQKAYAIQTDTVSGQWAIFANQARALGIDIGRALLPALKAIGTVLHTVVGAVNDLPAPMKTALAVTLASAAALLLLRGAYTKVTAQIAAFRAAQAAAAAAWSDNARRPRRGRTGRHRPPRRTHARHRRIRRLHRVQAAGERRHRRTREGPQRRARRGHDRRRDP